MSSDDDEVRGVSRKAATATALLVVGLFCLALWRVLSGSEHQAFAKGATPPSSSAVTAGHSYSLAVPGGVPAMLSHGISQINSDNSPALALTCQWSVGGAASQSLPVTSEPIGTKAETTVAHFVAPISGKLSITCDGWGAMFVPDADTGSGDPSGLFLLLSIITLTIGACLVLSLGYRASLERAVRVEDDGDFEDDEVGGLVDGSGNMA